MDFRLELEIKPWKEQLNLRHKLMLLGSCFTEHMAEKLSAFRFSVLDNPHGILFNPISIQNALDAYASLKRYREEDLFFYDGLWQSWAHHGRFSDAGPAMALQKMNAETALASEFLKQTDWMILTLGSAFVYELKTRTKYGTNTKPLPVANCHKVPQSNFFHRLLSFEEVNASLEQIVETARCINPAIKIIFTISPVRHHREGLVENNRSKGLLHLGVTNIIKKVDVFYFPAYELVIDDLRDYRFFAEDLVHPNYLATQYVWEKFSSACITNDSKALMERINRLKAAIHHRPRQPESENHKAFLAKMLTETKALQVDAPYLNLQDAMAYFGRG